jgi:hypothetical protein
VPRKIVTIIVTANVDADNDINDFVQQIADAAEHTAGTYWAHAGLVNN